MQDKILETLRKAKGWMTSAQIASDEAAENRRKAQRTA